VVPISCESPAGNLCCDHIKKTRFGTISWFQASRQRHDLAVRNDATGGTTKILIGRVTVGRRNDQPYQMRMSRSQLSGSVCNAAISIMRTQEMAMATSEGGACPPCPVMDPMKLAAPRAS
jgi:hypothetical protein